MFKIFLIVTLCGSIQIQAQHQPLLGSHSSVTVMPGIMTRTQDDADTKMNESLPVTVRRISSRGPLDSDTTRITPHPNSRSFPDIPMHSTVSVQTTSILDSDKAIANLNTSKSYGNVDGLILPAPKTTTDRGVTAYAPIIDNKSTTEIIPNVNPSTHNDVDHHSSERMNPTRIPELSSERMNPTRIPESSRRIEYTPLPINYEDNHHHHHHPDTKMNPSHLEDNKEDDSSKDDEDDGEDLCSSCLCDPRRINVYCKHEHLHDGKSHHLKLHAAMIPKTATSLHIQDFETVTITRNTFASQDLELRKITFENIHNLQLKKESLYFNVKASSNREVAVIITQCNIQEMPKETMTQYTRSEDQGSDIDLENTRFLTLHIDSCNISAIRSYALFQARLLFFKMSHTKVEQMEDHSFHVDVYEKWIVEHSVLPRMSQHTICLRAQMIVIFSHNTFIGLENRSLDIVSSNQVLFEFNRVCYLGPEALMGIVPEGRGANMVFLNNTVSDLQDRSLIIHRNYPIHERKILDNKFNITCDCDIKERFKPLMGITSTSDHYENQTYNALIENSFCRNDATSNIYSQMENYVSENCTPLPLPILISAGVVLVLILITIIVCVVCSKRAEKAKEEANYLGECCYSHSFSTLNSGNQTIASPPPFSEFGSWERSNKLQQPWVMAVPEVKTYQETEVNVHYEQTDPLNASMRGSYQEPTIDFQRRTQVRASCPFN